MSLIYRATQRAGRTLDRRWGIETAEQVGFEELGYATRERIDYDPSRWLALPVALRDVPVTSDDVFADIGSGKGRVVFQAARRYPLRRVIGVELSAKLNDVARANLDAERDRLLCRNVELVTADVLEWAVPDDLTIAYLFNPFRGGVFAGFAERLAEAVARRRRPLRIIYVYPAEHDRLLQTGHVVELPPPAPLLVRLAGLPAGGMRRYELRP